VPTSDVVIGDGEEAMQVTNRWLTVAATWPPCSRSSRAHDHAFDGVIGHLGACCLGQLAEALAIPPARRTKVDSRVSRHRTVSVVAKAFSDDQESAVLATLYSEVQPERKPHRNC